MIMYLLKEDGQVDKTRFQQTVPCHWCGKPAQLSPKWRYDEWKRVGHAYCSPVCGKAYKHKVNSETMAKTNRKYASDRMKKHNPMSRADVRQRASQSLRAIGHKPTIQGGNGRPMPEPQRILSEAMGWPTEVVVKTYMPRGSGYPPAYKIDVASKELMVGIEIDGESHYALVRQAQDAKKEELLSGYGWTVLRFSNKDVMQNLTRCVETVWSTISKSRDRIPS